MDNSSGGRYSPVHSTLNTDWNDLSDTQQHYFIHKVKETFPASLSVIALGQEGLVWRASQGEPLLHDTSKRKRFDSSSGIVEVLIKAYNQADSWQTKRQILSLFANDFTRSKLQNMVPGLSKWRIDQARQHATVAGKGQPPIERPIYHTKIDPVKINHFINFISRPEFVQDVAFGTKTLKLDSGERIIIPAVIRTLIPSRIIRQYMEYCRAEGFLPTSERSLYRNAKVFAWTWQCHSAFVKISAIVESLEEYGLSTASTQKLLKNWLQDTCWQGGTMYWSLYCLRSEWQGNFWV